MEQMKIFRITVGLNSQETADRDIEALETKINEWLAQHILAKITSREVTATVSDSHASGPQLTLTIVVFYFTD